MGSVVFFHQGKELPFINLRSEIEAFAKAMLERGISPKWRSTTPRCSAKSINLIKQKLLAAPYYINFVMGVGGMGGFAGSMKNLAFMIDQLARGPSSTFRGSGARSCR